jgi:hypothetical protein
MRTNAMARDDASRSEKIMSGPSRLDHAVERGTPIEIIVDDQRLPAFIGETVAVALLAAGRRELRRTSRRSVPRGLYCGIGVCFDCVMTIDGRPNVRTCQVEVRSGMRVESQIGDGRWGVTS